MFEGISIANTFSTVKEITNINCMGEVFCTGAVRSCFDIEQKCGKMV